MTRLALLRYPDPHLKMSCAPVNVFNDDLRQLSDDLLQVMRSVAGVGITAAHAGVLTRLVIVELDRSQGVRIFVNPSISWASEETAGHMEGSVCMPGATEEVTRPASVRFQYQDLTGKPHEEAATGFFAACMQHEIDQLDGIFWLQRLSRLKRDRVIKKWEKSMIKS